MGVPKRDSLTQQTAHLLPAWAQQSASELVLLLHVQPGARRTAVVGEHGQRLKVALHAPPVDGKANEELLRYLAGELRLRRGDVQLSAGAASREKSVTIQADAITASRIVVQLEGRAEAGPGKPAGSRG